MNRFLKALAIVFFLFLSANSYAQNEKPKTQEAKKSEGSCDSYTEFKKKQKAAREKKTAGITKQEEKK